MNYKAYPEYKDSGVEWIGEIPKEWEVKKLKYTTYVKGRIGWQGLTTSEFTYEGPYLVTGTDFVDGKVNWETCYHITQERYDEAAFIQLKKDDLLITKDGTIGKVALVEGDFGKASVNSGVFVTRPFNNEVYANSYMYYILLSDIFIKYICYYETGSTIKHLYQETFVNFQFPLPPMLDQLEISYFLNQETAKINRIVNTKMKLIEKLKEKRIAIISHAVTKGLDPNAKMKPSEIDWIGDIPEGWEVKKLKYVTSMKSGSSISALSFDENDEYPVYGGNGFRGFTSQYTHNGEYLLIGRQGALCGNVHLVKGKFWASEHAIVATKESDFNYYWMYSLLLSMNLNQYSEAAAQPGLSVDRILNLSIPFPDLRQQKAIAVYVEMETKRIDSIIAKAQASIEKLKEYQTSLISAAVTGKIDVRGESHD